MPDERRSENHISRSLQQIDANTWLIGGLTLHRSPLHRSPLHRSPLHRSPLHRSPLDRIPCISDTTSWNDDDGNSSYTLTKAPTSLHHKDALNTHARQSSSGEVSPQKSPSFPPPIPGSSVPRAMPSPPSSQLSSQPSSQPQASVDSSTNTQPDSPHIKLVYQIGDTSAVWSIGTNAFCKVKHIEKGITPESVTLDFVRDQQPTFEVPKVFYHTFDNNRSYLFLQRVPGQTLETAWPSLNEYWRHHYVNMIVEACKEMAGWQGHVFGGVNGQNIAEHYLLTRDGPKDFSSANMQKAYKVMGMDCTNIVFVHADLGPTNIIVEIEPSSGKIGIIDFEIAGYFPRDWIRTKWRISGGMDLSDSVTDDPRWWRREVIKALGANGFDDVMEAWKNHRLGGDVTG